MSKLKQLLFRLDDTDRMTIKEKLKEKDGQIDQLKQQLEEKDNKIKELENYKFRNDDYKVYYESTAMNYSEICEVYKNELDTLKQQLEGKGKEIESLKKDKEWYLIWHEKFKKQIEELTTELETYRPTKLHGNGQCKCHKCQAIHWTDWCNSYRGHIYCNNCLKEVLGNG